MGLPKPPSVALLGALALVWVLGHTEPALSQEEPQILVSFDEVGSMPCSDRVLPGQVDIYVTAHGIQEIAGYELELVPTVLPSFFLGRTLYGPEPIDLGVQYEVRVTTGACVSDPMLMGPSPWSWTLIHYEMLYINILNDVFFCVGPAPSSGASTPQYALCDPAGTQDPLMPLQWDESYGAPSGCAIANYTFGCWGIVSTEPESWGSLKSRFGD